MPIYTLAPVPGQTFLSDTGAIVPGGLIWTYLSGTSTPSPTYTVQDGSVAQTNPIVLDGFGRVPSEIYIPPGVTQKWVFQTAGGATIRTYPTVAAVPTSSNNIDIQGTAGEALAAGQTAYLSDGSGGKSAGQWYLGDATNAYSSMLNDVGMVPSAIASGATGTIRQAGSVTGLSSLTVGALYYISTTPGTLTATAPTNKRVIGQADTATSLVMSMPPAPAMALLKANSGTDTSAAAANVDTLAISGLTANDTLLVYADLESVTQQTASIPFLYNVTDGVAMMNARTIAAGDGTPVTLRVRQSQAGNTKINTLLMAVSFGASTNWSDAKQVTFTTAWTGTWTMALRHGGVTAGGTFRWSWSVYRLSGQ